MANMSQVITCKAAVCWGLGELLKVEEIQVDPPKATEVRVKMLCASLCHTDILSLRGFPYAKFPQVPGHEGIGVIESIGEKVRNVKEGDFVIPMYIGECQECENCLSNHTNLCSKYPLSISGLMADNSSRMSAKGQKIYHIFSCATWSEYTVIDESYVVKVDPIIDLAHASFISCGFSTGYGGAWKEARVTSGSTVAVFGLGAVGLGAISGAKMMGAVRIIGVDKNEKKRKKGEAFGMSDFINPGESDKTACELVMELTNGKGVDYSFECTGVGPLLNQTLESTKVGTGKTIAIGSGPTSVQISHGALLYGRTMMGSIFGGLKPKSDLPTVVHTCQKKEMPLDELTTHEVALTDIHKALEFFKQPDCVKVVIRM